MKFQGRSIMSRIVQGKGLCFASLCTFLFLLCGSALAADVTWTLGSNGQWSTGIGMDSTSNYPNGSTTNVDILDGTSTVTLDTSVSVASLH